MLDEPDKLGPISARPCASAAGSARPEQNQLHDHYLSVPFDLSNVLSSAPPTTWTRLSWPPWGDRTEDRAGRLHHCREDADRRSRFLYRGSLNATDHRWASLFRRRGPHADRELHARSGRKTRSQRSRSAAGWRRSQERKCRRRPSRSRTLKNTSTALRLRRGRHRSDAGPATGCVDAGRRRDISSRPLRWWAVGTSR